MRTPRMKEERIGAEAPMDGNDADERARQRKRRGCAKVAPYTDMYSRAGED
jgi:hypothetical protein